MIVRRYRQAGDAVPPRRIALIALVGLLLAAYPSDAAWASPATPVPLTPGAWISIGTLTGSAMPDAALGNYQWATLPRAAWGAQALAGHGTLAAGIRFLRSQTTQQNALPGETLVSEVRLTSLEAVGRVQLWQGLGASVMGTTSVGRLRIDYDPDRVEIDTGGGTPIEVRFAPIDEWIAGAGVAFSRSLAQNWSAGLEVERRAFRMNTAHRNGNTIEYQRETFGDWSARVELAWRQPLR